MADKFTSEATRIAVSALEEDVISAERQWQDAERAGDTASAAWALQQYSDAQLKLDRLTGGDQPQESGQLSQAQINFLNHRANLGDDVSSPARRQDILAGHVRAVQAGWPIDSPGYFSAVAGHLNHTGDGRTPGMYSEKDAAQVCGVDSETYANGAARLRALKRQGFYQD